MYHNDTTTETTLSATRVLTLQWHNCRCTLVQMQRLSPLLLLLRQSLTATAFCRVQHKKR